MRFNSAYLIIFVSLVSSIAHSAGKIIDPLTVYGDDGRLDLYQVQDPLLRRQAESVAALIKKSRLSSSKSGMIQVRTTPITELEMGSLDMPYCPDEKFAKQDVAAFCTGSLVASDVILTAGHCLGLPNFCEDAQFVFGFSLPTEGHNYKSVRAQDVYSCSSIIAFSFDRQKRSTPDWALIRLNRPVQDRAPLTISRTFKHAVGTPLYIIGYPTGLPEKLAGGAEIMKAPKGFNEGPNFFQASLDAFAGNSGSPVFNAKTAEIEGVLVRGSADYYVDTDNYCYRVFKCGPTCRGETSTSATTFLPTLEKILSYQK